jgi:hypothetical protein
MSHAATAIAILACALSSACGQPQQPEETESEPTVEAYHQPGTEAFRHAPIVALVRLSSVQQACTGGLRGLVEFEVIETARGPVTTKAGARFEGLPPNDLPLNPSVTGNYLVVAALRPVSNTKEWAAPCVEPAGVDAEYLSGVLVADKNEAEEVLRHYR